MAYKITQHRRGTTQEWLELDLVPYEGELVIEECEGNVRKCKIGDGKNPFSKLPYITDALAEELESEIGDLREQTNSTLNTAVDMLEQKIANSSTALSNTITTLDSDINKKVQVLSSDIEELSDKLTDIDSIVHDGIKSDVESLDARYSQTLTEITEQHAADVATLSADIETRANELTEAFETSLEQTEAKIEANIAATKTSLAEDYATKIEAAEERLQDAINSSEQTVQQHTKDLGDIQESIVELQTAVDSKSTEIDEKVSASEERVTVSIEEVQEAINKINFTLEQMQASKEEILPDFNINSPSAEEILPVVVEQLEDLRYKVNMLERGVSTSTTDIQNINIELARLATSLSNVLEQHKTSSDSFSKALSSLDSKLSKADSDITAAIAANKKEINENLEALTASDTLLYQVIYKIRDDLFKKIEATDTYLRAELEEDIALITKSVNDSKIKLDSKLAAVQSGLSDGVNTVKTELTKKLDNLEKLHDTRLSTNETSINALSTIVTSNQAALSSAIETVAADVANNKVNITNNSAEIDRVYSVLDDKINLANSNVDALNTKVNTQISGVESRMQTLLAATDQIVQQQAEAIHNIQDNITDLDQEIDDRIVNKISDSVAETNTNILEIRAAIGQINLTLELLKSEVNNNPGGNNNNSLLLLAEQLAELQHKITLVESDALTTNAEIQLVKNELSRLVTTLTGDLDNVTKTTSAAINSLDTKLSKADADILDALATHTADMADDLADLVADDILLYQIIYRIRDELLSKVNATQTDLQTNIATIANDLNQSIIDTKAILEEQLTQAQKDLTGALTTAESRLDAELSRINTLYNAKTSTNKKEIDDLRTTVDANQAELLVGLETVASDIADNKTSIANNMAALNQVNSTLEGKVALINSNIDILDSQLEAQANRIDSLIAFDLNDFTIKDGEITKEDFTKLAQEVSDIRNGYDGTTHESAQAAVRAIGDNLTELESKLSQYVETKAVGGLRYDVTGEYGLMQPYMLYLETPDGEVIQDSGVQIIGGAGGGPGGGGASTLKINYDERSPQEIKVTPSNEVKIYFTFSGTDASGDTIRTASATWRIDGVVVERGTIKSGENYFDATKYVKDGTVKVHLTVNDDNGSTATKSWEIQQINLKIESEFSDKKTYPVGESFTFYFKPTGAINKVARFILDGDELGVDISAPDFPIVLDATKSGDTVYCDLPAMSHGSHLLEVYLEADVNGTTVASDHILKDIICFDTSDKAKPPVIGTITQSIMGAKQYSTTNIIYTVYSNTTDTPVVDIMIDGSIVSNDYTVMPNKDYGNTPTAIYPYVATDPGLHEIKIVCEGIEKVIDIFVEDLGLNITPVKTGLAFDFNPAGKNNGDIWSDKGVSLSVSDNFDWTNGGYLPNDPDGPCFCVKAGSTATISHKLFEKEAKETGKEFKLVFKTKNVANPDAVFLSCVDSETSSSRVGLQMGVHNATIYGKSGNLELAYSEEDVIEFEFNISQYSTAADALNMVMGYEDGVPSRPMVYDNSYSFKQDSANVKPITIGSPDCDVYIYRLKVYNISLSTADILNNFIADARTTEEMVDRYTRNQIYDENRKLTPEALAAKCPWLRVIKVSAPKFTSSKKDDIAKTTIQQIYGQGRPSDNWVAYDAVHSGQGTSSDNYGAAGRNLDLKVRIVKDKNGNPINTNPYFLYTDEQGEDKIVQKVSLTDTSIPVDYFNIKVNIASSNNLTNAIIAKRYNEFNPYKRSYIRDDESIIPYLKDTMEFYNCVVFIQETDPDVTTHREFADNDWHFYAIGNIGDSKKTDKTRLTDPNDKYECCVEIMDVGLPLSGFPCDTMIDAMGYTIDEETNEQIYTWAKDENLGILFEREYSLTADSEVNLNKTYYIEVDGKMVNAMEYVITEVRDYIWAKNENLGLLYELIDGEYIKTEDTEVDLEKVYYIEVEEKDTDGNVIGTTFADAMGYTTKEVKTYTYAKNENLDKLYEVTYFKTNDTEVNYNKTYYVDILEHDDFSEDYTYGWRYISDDEDSDVVNTCKQAWIDFYRFVTTSTDEEFKAHFGDYFVKDSALYYYLFTTRYCMVDNRAKNTFWHYGKTTDGTRKWDLCWDYDNDTSLGLNNYGKQVYRYGLEDIDHDATGEEVFRQSDSTFFCRVRDMFGPELRNMYQSLESSNAWNANAFINESDAWQEQFPEELWRIDIERKYIRTYTSSFVNGGSWKQGLTTMSNGRMKYHRRQWERNQEQYMASKYQTTTALGDAAHANFRVGRPSVENLAITPSYQFTLTPYSYIYLNVQYGGTSPISVRAVPNVPTVIPYAGTSADIINVGSAAAISNFGDLSAFYPKTASVQNATRIKKLKLGNNTAGYSNTLFQSLDTGNNNLLEELDLTNITSYTGSLDLKQLINLRKLYAFGTGLTSVSFADGGKLSYVELPAVNNITLKNLAYLESNSLKLASYSNVEDLVVDGCSKIDKVDLFNKCPNLKRVRLIDIDFGEISYEEFTTKVFKLRGISPTGSELTNAVLTGKVRFNDPKITGEQYNQIKERYPDLEVSYNELESTLKFMRADNETELCRQTIINGQDGEAPAQELTDTLIKAPSENGEFTYTWIGWSTEPNSNKVDADALKNVEGDRVLYPVFKSTTRTYTVTFINPTEPEDSEYYSCVVNNVLYGTTAICPWSNDEIRKQDAADPTAYVFNGWRNASKPIDANVFITGNTECYAVFAYANEAVLSLADITGEGLLNRFGRPLSTGAKGYTVNEAANTMEIIACKPCLNASIIVPDKLEGMPYKVVALGGFYAVSTAATYNHKKLAHIKMADTITSLLEYAFMGCTNLSEVELSNSLRTIGTHCFENCSSLTGLSLPDTLVNIDIGAFIGCTKLTDINTNNNDYVKVIDNCLVNNGTIVFGKFVPGICIPDDATVTRIAEESFVSNNHLSPELIIPDSIIEVGRNAFKYCSSITSVEIKNKNAVLNGMCFDQCSNLKSITLPEKLLKIPVYAFSKTALQKIELPSTINDIGDSAFSDIHGTETNPFIVTFAEGTNINNLTINAKAFNNCTNIQFNLPWTETEYNDKFNGSAWGAVNPTFIFNGGNN